MDISFLLETEQVSKLPTEKLRKDPNQHRRNKCKDADLLWAYLFFCHSLVSVGKGVKICDFNLSMLYKCTHICKYSAYICFHIFYSTLCFFESHKLNFYGFVMCVCMRHGGG